MISVNNNIFIKKNTVRKELEYILGLKLKNSLLFKRALSHSSANNDPIDNNERLEYLGDAVLGAIVADYLFKLYPYKSEGFLTEMRSKMVNRQKLNDVAIKMGLHNLVIFNKQDKSIKHSQQIFGNTLEAVIGAIYLDKGYEKTKKWVLKQIVIPLLEVEELETIEINLKNKIIGWASKNNHELSFETIEEKYDRGRRIFVVAVVLNGEQIAIGSGFSKKEAGQIAANMAHEVLNI